jgi:hypothetical protein
VSSDKFSSLSVGKKLRDIRKGMGVTSAHTLSELMGHAYSPSGILRREEGNLKIDFEYLESFCTALKIKETEKDKIFSIAKLDLWRGKKSVLDLSKEVHKIRLNAKTEIRFSTAGFPLEVQIPEFTREVILRWRDYGDVEERIRLRQETARITLNNPQKDIRVITSENAFYIPFGTPELMIKQLEYYKGCKLPDNLKLRLLPMSCFIQKPTFYSFTVFDNQFVACETRIGSITAEEDQTVRELINDFEEIWAHSLAGNARNALIDKAIAHFQTMLLDGNKG